MGRLPPGTGSEGGRGGRPEKSARGCKGAASEKGEGTGVAESHAGPRSGRGPWSSTAFSSVINTHGPWVPVCFGSGFIAQLVLSRGGCKGGGDVIRLKSPTERNLDLILGGFEQIRHDPT